MRTSLPDSGIAKLVEDRARFIRLETLRLVSIAKSGHYTSVFSCAEILAALYYSVLNVDPERPDWPERDRFVMSKGHAAVGLYPVLADRGFFAPQLLDDYTRVGSRFADHPRPDIPGIDFGSGSLGHGLSVSAGMAVAGRLSGRSYRVHCLLGDGELNEGQIWEAAMSAAHLGLGNLVATVDRNLMSLDGFTEEVMRVEPVAEKWRSFGWLVRVVDGHDPAALLDAYGALPAADSDRPVVLIAHTLKGKGIPWMELSRHWHLGALVGADLDEARHRLAAGDGGAPR